MCYKSRMFMLIVVAWFYAVEAPPSDEPPPQTSYTFAAYSSLAECKEALAQREWMLTEWSDWPNVASSDLIVPFEARCEEAARVA